MSAERARRGEEPAGDPRGLQAGGGGGTSDGMDARVARLEAHVEVLRADVADMRVSLATLTERVAILMERIAILPGKGFFISSTAMEIALLSAVVFFGEKLQVLVGI